MQAGSIVGVAATGIGASIAAIIRMRRKAEQKPTQ
jgi:hypothetical protein